MPQDKQVRVSRKELLVKSLVYRAWTVCWESALASILLFIGATNLFLYILLVNAIKVAVYFAYDLGWFNFLRRPGLLRKIRRLLRVG